MSTERARVPWQCRSAKGQSVLTERLTDVYFGKGHPVNIPELFKYAWQHKLCFRRFRLSGHGSSFVLIIARPGSIVTMRTGGTMRTVFLWRIPPMPRALENGTQKNLEYLYPEPALVPLGEKPKV